VHAVAAVAAVAAP